MSSTQINRELFFSRLQQLHSQWLKNRETPVWAEANALCIIMGSRDDDITYKKSSSLHLWLLGYEFTDTILLLVKKRLYILTSRKKAAIVEPLLEGNATSEVQVEVLQRMREDNNQRNFNDLIAAIRKQGIRLGTLTKERVLGEFANSWLAAIDKDGLEKVDVSHGVGYLLAVKDEEEATSMVKAAVMTNKVMKKKLKHYIEEVMDKGLESENTHDYIANVAQEALDDPSKVDVAAPEGVIEACYYPIVQSGGNYDLRPNAQSDNKPLSYDIIIAACGARYRNYCAHVARTFFVDAPRKVETCYKVLLKIIDECKSKMSPGEPLNAPYLAAQKYLEERHPTLKEHLPKNVGFCLGLEFRDGTMVMNARNSKKFRTGMIFNLSVGLQNVPLSHSEARTTRGAARKLESFSLLVADTVKVVADGAPEVLTSRTSKEPENVSYNIDNDEDEDEDEDEDVEEKVEVKPDPQASNPVLSRLRDRSARNEADADNMKRYAEQQKLLQRNMRDYAERRLRELSRGGGDDDETIIEAKEIKCFSTPREFPRELIPNQVFVDRTRECVMLPICGAHVPFHISTIKNVAPPDAEQDVTFLRINFFGGGSITKDMSPSVAALVRQFGGEKVFVKEMLFRSLSNDNLRRAYREIQELRKRVRSREAKEAEEADLVEQAKLVRLRDQRTPRLADVLFRPHLRGRKSQGHLEAHANGLRFSSVKGEVLDIMYGNIRRAIMQPCSEGQMVVVLHFYLKNPIMVGNKKWDNLQVLTEAEDASIALESARRRHYDPDELEDEQRKKALKKRLDNHFRAFSLKVEKICEDGGFPVRFDTPWSQLGFNGTPNKEMVFLQPTQFCLVNVTDWPPFVVDLEDVEHAHFERLSTGGHANAFDLTFILNDHKIMPKTIGMIDRENLDPIQDWLTQNAITYTATSQNINWKQVMASDIVQDPRFYEDTDEDGNPKPPGWAYFNEDEDDDDEEEEDAVSEFEEPSDESEEEDDSDEDDSDDYADEDEESEDDYEDEEEDEGDDWDELEAKARESDKVKRDWEEDEPPRHSKKRRR